MKKVVLLIIVCTIANMVCAQQADTTVVFHKLVHDFGAIVKTDGEQEYLFEFTNKGIHPVSIQKVTTSCGCTSSDWTKEPVAPGKRGYVKVTYHPTDATVFNKTVAVNIEGGSPKTVVLHIRGNVTEKR
jgi:hypothetical protein